jgi:hypothetical protein
LRAKLPAKPIELPNHQGVALLIELLAFVGFGDPQISELHLRKRLLAVSGWYCDIQLSGYEIDHRLKIA